jgi:2-hydroxychromene-2-carboxylate isomerase|tara:strand:- start:327 stop:977 length:651 start_codon:yes stop_codon:yes gene_type:complete
MKIDFYFSFRSPYSYLILPRIIDLKKDYEIEINFKLVYPLAIREPEFFKGKNIFTYFIAKTIDMRRVAKKHNMKFGSPKPDPIVQNLITGKISPEQPYIYELCLMGQLMTNKGLGIEFAYNLSKQIFGGIKDWNSDENLASTFLQMGENIIEINKQIILDKDELINQIKENQIDQVNAGHHGVPLMVHKESYYFGQDNFDRLLKDLKAAGLKLKQN